ncbi:uncharacterized protein B4U79_04372, partial [Dinothrombium tinctorium]
MYIFRLYPDCIVYVVNINKRVLCPTFGERHTSSLQTDEKATDLSTVAIKLPPFWTADPELWFHQIEAQFELKGITSDKTKFNYIASSLSGEIASEVRDLLISPPKENMYGALKKALISRTSVSEEQRLQQLLQQEELGDRKPSQLLRRMKQLVGDKISIIESTMFRSLFMQRLPEKIRLVLVAAKEEKLETIAEMADKVMEVITPASSIAAIGNENEIDKLQKEVNELRKKIKRLSITNARLRRHSRSRSIGGRNRIQQTDEDQKPTCWYHRRKRNHGSLTATSGPSSNSCRLFISDPMTKINFLIDTGATVSVIPAKGVDRRYRQELLLSAANQSSIATYGQRSLTISLGFRREFKWVFTLADVKQAIVGADFLKQFGLVVDLRNRKLVDNTTQIHVAGKTVRDAQIGLMTKLTSSEFDEILK